MEMGIRKIVQNNLKKNPSHGINPYKNGDIGLKSVIAQHVDTVCGKIYFKQRSKTALERRWYRPHIMWQRLFYKSGCD